VLIVSLMLAVQSSMCSVPDASSTGHCVDCVPDASSTEQYVHCVPDASSTGP